MTDGSGSPSPLVVFGDDGSNGADIAWLWINSQRWAPWRLDVVRAEPVPDGRPAPDEDAELHPVAGSPHRTVFAEAGFETIRFLTAAADPRVVLSRCDDAALLVVGPVGTGRAPFHLGSTTEWLLHTPPAPMVIARSGTPVERAMVCADGSDHSVAAAQTFAGLPWASGVEVTLLVVADGRVDTGSAADRLQAALADHVGGITIMTREGDPRRVALAEAEDAAADLMVLGTRGLSGLRRLVVGSTASAVSRNAPCSVLVAQSLSDQEPATS